MNQKIPTLPCGSSDNLWIISRLQNLPYLSEKNFSCWTRSSDALARNSVISKYAVLNVKPSFHPLHPLPPPPNKGYFLVSYLSSSLHSLPSPPPPPPPCPPSPLLVSKFPQTDYTPLPIQQGTPVLYYTFTKFRRRLFIIILRAILFSSPQWLLSSFFSTFCLT